MGCKACERRRKALAEKRRKKQEQGKQVQAAALGAALAVTEAVGNVIGIHGEEPHVKDRDDARRNEGVQTGSGQP